MVILPPYKYTHLWDLAWLMWDDSHGVSMRTVFLILLHLCRLYLLV